MDSSSSPLLPVPFEILQWPVRRRSCSKGANFPQNWRTFGLIWFFTKTSTNCLLWTRLSKRIQKNQATKQLFQLDLMPCWSSLWSSLIQGLDLDVMASEPWAFQGPHLLTVCTCRLDVEARVKAWSIGRQNGRCREDVLKPSAKKPRREENRQQLPVRKLDSHFRSISKWLTTCTRLQAKSTSKWFLKAFFSHFESENGRFDPVWPRKLPTNKHRGCQDGASGLLEHAPGGYVPPSVWKGCERGGKNEVPSHNAEASVFFVFFDFSCFFCGCPDRDMAWICLEKGVYVLSEPNCVLFPSAHETRPSAKLVRSKSKHSSGKSKAKNLRVSRHVKTQKPRGSVVLEFFLNLSS